MTDLLLDLSPREAEAIIESLRTGIPPVGYLREFTVGRAQEIARLEKSLEGQRGASALLVEANYGGGKTHLLRLIRELAFDAGYAVAMVTVDSKSGVRFNRMDQVAAAVMRSVELDHDSVPGIWNVFEAYHQIELEDPDDDQLPARREVSDEGRWGYSDRLEAPAIYVALRAWIHGHDSELVRSTVVDWLSYPWEYKSSKRKLYEILVGGLRARVRDPRPDIEFYAGGVFEFDTASHWQAWASLRDLNLLVQLCGRRGLVLLFDEFEDVIQNMRNIRFEQMAFVNLFHMFEGTRVRSMSYFAVTPDFTHKCRQRLYERYVYDFPVERFDRLERFAMSPVTKAQFLSLATRIRATHGSAYSWPAEVELSDDVLHTMVDELFSRPSSDQVRQAVEGFVHALDERAED